MSNPIASTEETGNRRSFANWIALASILLSATFLYFFRLDQGGFFTGQYYAATVKSMLTSWHNFIFASFDPGGFVNVDKPPFGFWIQAISATIFGFGSWSLLAPQALAGVLSIALLYHLTARAFGAVAALIATLVLTVTPITVATNRNNTIDSQLVLVLLLAAWAASIAAEQGQLRWLFVSALLVGVGFNIKMLQAYMVLPALWLTYLLAARVRWPVRIAHLSCATITLAVVSFAWPVFVDTTPPAERPYVGTSESNSEMDLIFGQYGLSRLGQLANLIGFSPSRPAGQPSAKAGRPVQVPPDQAAKGQAAPRPGQARLPQANLPPNQSTDRQERPTNQRPGQQQPLGQPAPQRIAETGDPGALRLFNRQLGAQISWFLPLATSGLFAVALHLKIRSARAPAVSALRDEPPWIDRRIQQLMLWGLWLIPMLVYFSFGGVFHRYYLVMLAPAIAVLTGAGLAALWQESRLHRRLGATLLLALLVGGATQVAILRDWSSWNSWLLPFVVVACGGIVIVFALLRVLAAPPLASHCTAIAGFLSLLVAPTFWSITPLMAAGALMPYAGPELLSQPNRNFDLPQNTRLTDYLITNRDDAKFLVATPHANSAAPIILVTGEPVMALGGYTGFDPILTPGELAARVAANDVRFFLIPPRSNSDPALSQWVTTNCRRLPYTVPRNLQRLPNTPIGNEGTAQLYDCRAQ